METKMMDALVAIPAARRLGFRQWMAGMARSLGFGFIAQTADMTPYPAEINYGRWIARCQNCAGAENVTADDPVMMCFSCGNEHLGGRLAVVSFPDEMDRRVIEETLMARPKPNRNWEPHETPDFLAEENTAHGRTA